ncbi:UDP-glycosyltransferase 89A2-like [Gossypium hirsutum]|uniref:UDP-glycosyltransferase 89A2-like n=1 Tax=Gossypium hirsutum TaxID=3635 RepID=A0ABM2YTB4_GOSHI|nr:UDP-glycosyltransferase 89A2-like [Gossypium hirsutum]
MGALVGSTFGYIWNSVEKVKSLSEIEFGYLPGYPGLQAGTFAILTHVGHNRVFSVGPLSLVGPDVSDRGNLGSVSDINVEVLTWLDRCPDGSVVYVCLGSQKLLRKEQMEALANGLEKSGTRFIWWRIRAQLNSRSKGSE